MKHGLKQGLNHPSRSVLQTLVRAVQRTEGADEVGWQAEKSWVFVVGTLQWKYPDMLASFPTKNRRDAALVEFFEAEGVPADQIVYLQDEAATQARIEREFLALLKRGRPGDMLFVYYCGHGCRDDEGVAYFANYDMGDEGAPGWPMTSVPTLIEKHFKGSLALVAADCCHAGSLVDAVRETAKRVSFAAFGSSMASESSTGNWTFTDCLLAGLQGQSFADAAGDGLITLHDLADEILEDMVFAEEQYSTFHATGQLATPRAIARSDKKAHPRIGARVEARSGDEWYRGRIVAVDESERFRVRYYGYDEEDDEWVEAEALREPKPSPYKAGEAVEVHWKQTWYPARILQVVQRVHRIRYDDYDEAWDEWVGVARIRRHQDK